MDRNKGGKGSTVKPSMKVSSEELKLHESENAWRPAMFNVGRFATDEDKTTEQLYRKVSGILNKVTPQKFDTLWQQIRTLPIDNSERLQGVIDLVFKNAVNGPKFSATYACICGHLACLQVPTSISTEEKPDFVNFRKLLITRCQVEFEKQTVDENVRTQKIKEIDACTDPERKKDLEFELEEYFRRLRMKSVGNTRFIGELFKQHMLTQNIMMRCLSLLLENKDEESLECLCKLLTTIGKELESKQVSLTQIFGQMKQLADRKDGSKISSRIRFMLQDVIDLRNSKWVPLRQDSDPKMIDQIQKEAEQEQMNIQMMNSVPMTAHKDDRSGGSGGGNQSSMSDRKSGRIRNMTEDGGWMTMKSQMPFSVQNDKQSFNKSEFATDEDKKTNELYRKVRGILNKLTPQIFDMLLQQIRTLSIDNSERLQGVIDLIFEKAVDDPNFSAVCASMCGHLAPLQVPTSISTEEKPDFVNFRKLLITRCQVEFEKQTVDENIRTQKIKEIDACTDLERKKDLEFELKEYFRRLRMRSVGNTRFIGELFKQHILTHTIMMRCLRLLLDNKNEESLECLCVLLTTIGKELESKQVSLAQIFVQMKQLADRKDGSKISSRIRFMLQDVIDLRNSKWVPRRQDSNPKMIEQIQKETKQEQMNIQMMNSVPMTLRKDDRGGGGGGGNQSSSMSDRKRGRTRNMTEDGGWTTMKSKMTFSVQSDKLKAYKTYK